MSEEERQAIIHLLDKQARYEYCINNSISFSDEDYEAYIIRQSMINKDKEIERLNKELQTTANKCKQKENIIKEVREYINDNVMVYAFNDKKFPHWDFNDDNINDILEILDKGSDEISK